MRTIRLSMVCSGITHAMRQPCFPLDGPLETRSARLASQLANRLQSADAAFSGAARRARETAACLTIEPVVRDDLNDQNYGTWAGRSVAELEQDDPQGLAGWTTDPGFAPPSGESMGDVAARAGAFLDDMRQSAGHIVAVTHPAVIRAAVLRILEAPLTAVWRIDTPPLTVTDLRYDGRRWVLRGHGLVNPSRGDHG